MNLTIGHIIAYSLDAQFRFNGRYPGPHRDISKNIELINRVLTENGYNQSLHTDAKNPGDCAQCSKFHPDEDCDGHPL